MPEVSHAEADRDVLAMFEDLRGKSWNVYRVSHLLNFEYQKPKSFSRYGRILSRYLVDSFTEAVVLKASFSLLPNLKEFQGGDPPVQIKIEDVQLDQPRLVYEGVLLSAYNSSGRKLDGLVHLPVLLARGTTSVRDKVHGCLAKLFSSAVVEVTFPCEDMLWMIAAWTGYINETRMSKEVTFVYQVPHTKDSITCQYSVDFVKRLWGCIHSQESPIVELDEVRHFHASLIRHTKEMLGLNLAAVPLIMYKTPDFELYSTGKVKVKTTDFIPRILHYIADMCESHLRLDF